MEKKQVVGISVVALVLTLSTMAFARTIDPIVSTEWLNANGDMEGLVILDVRSDDAYAAGHIDGAVSEPFVVPFSAWITMPEETGFLLELPPESELFAAIGDLGIDTQSKVVVVADPSPGEPAHYGPAGGARVASTLIYAGVADVAILDGGHTKWVADGYAVSTDDVAPIPVVFDGASNPWMFVSTEYVRQRAWWANLIDARDAAVYFGATIEPFAPVPGHIPTAMSLPTPWAYEEDMTFKSVETLDDMSSGVLGRRGHPFAEIIVYCGVGGYAGVWWYLLSQVLGYHNVKFYDGSAQAWVAAEHDMVPYKWK